MTVLRGKVSWFGGPDDTGVDPDEGLAFIYDVDDAPELFLPKQPPGTTGLARRLNPDVFYIACRWDYEQTPKDTLVEMPVRVRALKTGAQYFAVAADWGPHEDTGRIADISPGLMEALGITTDDEVEVSFDEEQQGSKPMTPYTYNSICISSGHSTKCQGASSILNEVEEATKITDDLAEALRDRGVEVETFHDTLSTSQNENLNRITDWHNSKTRDLDISVHFNAYVETPKAMGCEVLYVSQSALAADLSAAIASCGFIDRGAKYRSDLFVLNNCEMPTVLIEVCFVDSVADADLYRDQFDAIVSAMADVLGGPAEEAIEPPGDRPPVERPERPPPVAPPVVSVGHVDIEISGPVTVTVNRVPVTMPS